MNEKQVMLTREGLHKLEQELDHLRTVKRKEVAERIKQAAEFGDITENSEYDEAKNEQAFVEGRIQTLERMLRNASIIEEDGHSDAVFLGSKVKVRDVDTGEEMVYTIVGSAEANPNENRISNESPVGQALMGKKVDSEVLVQAPAGQIKYHVMDILA